MKITKVEAIPLTAALPDVQRTSTAAFTEISICLVRVQTDAGISGVGECLARFAPTTHAEMIDQLFRPMLVGEDPFALPRLWEKMASVTSGRSGGVQIEAIAGVDIALWDIMGKELGVNVARLLGGEYSDHVPAYASSVMVMHDTDKEARRLLDLGFTRIKMKIGNGLNMDLRRISKIREIVGPEITIVSDVNYSYREPEAELLANRLAQYDVLWLEEPIHPSNRNGYRRLARRSPVPLAAGESEFTALGFSDLIADGSVKFVQPDVTRAGGISESRKIAALADSFGLYFAPHVGFSGIVCLAATLQLAAVCPNLWAYECMTTANPFREALAVDPVGLAEQLDGGSAALPHKPGLGIELDWGAVEKLKIR
jgi:galactonate dehydratase